MPWSPLLVVEELVPHASTATAAAAVARLALALTLTLRPLQDRCPQEEGRSRRGSLPCIAGLLLVIEGSLPHGELGEG